MDRSSNMMELAIESDKRMSRRKAGSGRNMTMRIITTPTARASSELAEKRDMRLAPPIPVVAVTWLFAVASAIYLDILVVYDAMGHPVPAPL